MSESKPCGMSRAQEASRVRGSLRNALVIGVTTVVILAGVWIVNGVRLGGTDPNGVSSTQVAVPEGQSAPAIGTEAPDFTASTIDGTTITLSTLRGKPVWLIFAATWCTNCRAEAPDVQKVSNADGDRVHVITIYVGESHETVVGYANRVGLTFNQIADTNQIIASAYAVMGIPAHYFIDADGVIQQITVGTLTQDNAMSILDPLLH